MHIADSGVPASDARKGCLRGFPRQGSGDSANYLNHTNQAPLIPAGYSSRWCYVKYSKLVSAGTWDVNKIKTLDAHVYKTNIFIRCSHNFLVSFEVFL